MGFLKSIKTLFGSIVHYNERGEKVGETLDGFFPEQKLHYDNDGNYLWRTDPGLLQKNINHKRSKQQRCDNFFRKS